MADVVGQTTDRLLGDTSPYTPRVLLRNSIELYPTTVSGSGYLVLYQLDITYLNIQNIVPSIELYRGNSSDLGGPYVKCPLIMRDSGGTITQIINTWISFGSAKDSGDDTVKLNIQMYSSTSTRYYMYFQLTTTPVADTDQSLFTYLGSYS